jgi:hypothetical protein
MTKLRFNGLLSLILITGLPTALACSPIKVRGVYFERDSSAVSASQVSRLANWVIDLHQRYPNHQAFYVSASTEPGEQAPNRLGMDRARNIARVLQENLQIAPAKIELPERSYVEAPVSAYLKQLEKSQGVRVDLGFLPACPHECPCQLGDPLYKPEAPKQ